jgi:hypothetical protein
MNIKFENWVRCTGAFLRQLSYLEHPQCYRVLPRTAAKLLLLLPRIPGLVSSHRQEDLTECNAGFR